MNHNQENTNFEDFIKESFESYEVEYNPSHWSEIEQRLKQTSASSTNLAVKLTAIIGLVAISGFIYYSFSPQKASVITDKSLTRQATKHELTKENEINKDKEITVSNKESVIKQVETKPIISSEATHRIISKKSDPVIDDENRGKTEEKIDVKSDKEEALALPSPELTGDFNIVQPSKCNLSTLFFVEKPANNYSYEWDFGDGNKSIEVNPKHVFKTPGKFNVHLTVLSNNNNKLASSKKQIVIEETAAPTAKFEWIPFYTASLKYGAEFTDKTNNATEWQWDFGDNQFSREKNPRHVYQSKGKYQVKLIVKNQEGCSDTVKQLVVLEENNPLLAPTVFTPDGDGLNDSFIPKALEATNQPFEMVIYDRAGSPVYRTTDASKPWNGQHMKAGDIYSNTTTFYWFVFLKDDKGEEKTFFGPVTVIK